MFLIMLAILAVQAIVVILFARFGVFNFMGRDYKASVIMAGIVGFCLGSRTNALSSMNEIGRQYGKCEDAMSLISLIVTLIVDFVNPFVITLAINIVA